jgi:excinuclease ABC subunit C
MAARASRVFGVVVDSSARTRSTAAARSSAPPASADPADVAIGPGAEPRALPGGTARATRGRKKAPSPHTQLDLAVGSPEADVANLREHVRAGAKNRPGVYLMRGPHGEILYVGKSTQLRTRLLSYFRLPWPEHRHARMLRETARIEWEETPSEFAALLREVRLIRAYLPRYNIRSARPLDRWWVVTLGEGPAPRLKVQRASLAMRGRSQDAVVGPFASRRPLVNALRVLNDALGLRDCTERVPMVLRDGGDLFDHSDHPAITRRPGCHRYETRRCLGPCVGACSGHEYRVQIGRARAVLEGRDDGPQQQLMREMATASAAMSYERAGWIRDRLVALQALEAQLARVREAITRPSCVYAVTGVDGDDRLYLIRHGRVVDEARCSDADTVNALQARERVEVPTPMSAPADQLDELLMIEQWFRTRPGEKSFTAPTVVQALQALAKACSTGLGVSPV